MGIRDRAGCRSRPGRTPRFAARVLAGALVLAGAIHPAGGVDRTALRWHAGVWDLWFLVWGILLALATIGYRQRTAHRSAAAPARSPGPQ